MKELRDQSAHFAAAFLLCLIVAHSPFAGALIGFSMGLVREITEEREVSIQALWNIANSKGSRLDLTFWTLGGFSGGIL